MIKFKKMAAFSYHQHNNSYLLDQTVSFPNTSSTTQLQYRLHNDDHQVVLPPVANNLQHSPASSMSMVVDDHNNVDTSGINDHFILAKKRKDKQISSSLNHAQSKDTSNLRLKKQKKSNDFQKGKKKKNASSEQEEEEEEEEGAVGYIHVRARRGQATDSHSLAERVRREKISERMKLLQAIVPGCDKVTGKALMLDEIINYVQSLQNQVEFLSMKLASVNPMLYDFGVDLDSFMLKPDENMSSMVLPIMPSLQQCSLNGGAATFAPANDNYHQLPHLIDGANSSVLFQQSQMPNILSQGNNGQQLWDIMDDQRLKLDSRFSLTNNLTSFH